MDEDYAVSQVVIGTEFKQIIILDPTGTNLQRKYVIEGVPAYIDIMGLLEVDYTMTIVTRDGKVIYIRNGELTPTKIELESKPCGIARLDQSFFVACMDNFVYSYNHRSGKKNFALQMPAGILCLEPLEYGAAKGTKGLLIALANCELRMYSDRLLIHCLPLEDVATSLRFGVFGREDGCLVVVHKTKGIDVKILQRQFNINNYGARPAQLQDQDVPLNLPKKTKLFFEQSQRERDQAGDMYRNYQKDLLKMRLKVSQVYHKLLSEGGASAAQGTSTTFRIDASVQGLGPHFKLSLIHISEPTRLGMISYAVFCLKKKKLKE
eukprot:TRINITY_DN7522_c0_g1_i5.p1 TRINITY_DN7522_c0_g1~~TRINITY_DN7522_c0_g1_i5.p1  ORF type:complete len:322 (-),score=59.99 TRINITY_DN7522_c0_g1_i5:21-986(-)